MDNIREIPLSVIEDKAPPEVIDPEEFERLKTSISEQGLLHPITVYEEDGRFWLEAGRKRLGVFRQLGRESIMALIIPVGTSPEKRKEIHLHENLMRFNLPWYEQVVMIAELHQLRQDEHGVRPAHRPSGRKKEGWSLKDTAMELGRGFGTISEDLRLAEAVMLNPNLRKIQDKVTAKRLIFQDLKRIEAEVEAGLVPKSPFDCVLLGECGGILSNYPSNSFDVVLTDPPWLQYKEEKLVADDKTLPAFKEIYRVMRLDSFLLMFVSIPDFILYLHELPQMGFKVQGTPLIWAKEGHMTHGLRSWEFSRDFEPILVAVKGAPVLINAATPSSIFTFPIVHNTKLIHPNEKPLALMKRLLAQVSHEGSMVLDPFGGSGVTGEACINMKRRYVLIERDKKYYDNIERRLKNAGHSTD